jgi:triacylglycerol esterase/lipase EstA (alpha/beta hydrolase family)
MLSIKPPLVALFASFTCLLLSNCSHIASVSEHRPVFRPLGLVSGLANDVQTGISEALKSSKRDPMASLGGYLTAAESASRELAKNPADEVLRDDYNFVVARILAIIQEKGLDPWSKPLTVAARGGDFQLTRKPDARKEWNPALYDFTPADQFDVSGTFIKTRTVKHGLGAPIVAIGKEKNVNARKNFALPRTYYGVTALVRFSGRRCEIAFEDPLATETVEMNGITFPLAADFTVPVAVMLASTDTSKMGLARLLNPDKYADTARIARLQPYDPNKTVVLVVHGLNSSPATWTHMINSLRDNESIRRNYQFWFYSYPSGWPYPHSAAVLRKELDAVEKRYPMKKKMVVIGHSMGGCISRLLITDVGDQMWMKFFRKPPQEVNMSAESKQLFQDALIFNHRPEIGRVIFVAAPLKGADLAAGWMGRLGSKLVKAPLTFAKAGVEMLKVATFQNEGMNLHRIPNSVDTLAPTNRFVIAINTFPLSRTIPYHSIVGDRGKGGNKDHTKPVSSDGLVPYWSSHLPEAKSELIVPSGHSAHLNDQAVGEVKRILLLHTKAATTR